VVDMERVYARHAAEPVFLPTDAVHPSQGGHHLEASTLYDVLVRRGVLEAPRDAGGSEPVAGERGLDGAGGGARGGVPAEAP
jgi:hypothetical protein